MWCANRFQYPLDRNNYLSVLSEMAQRSGDTPLIAAMENNKAVGFFCYSLNRDAGEGKLKFVIVDPEYRGKGTA
jgi:ribosomal protein S18 acetylase RimI-like enzyme